MTQNAQTKPAPLTWSDFLVGAAQLATEGVVEVTDLVEAIHKEIVLRPFPATASRPAHLAYQHSTGRIYQIIKRVMRISGGTTGISLRLIDHTLKASQKQTSIPNNIKLLANVINGVMGDHLVSMGSPLALPMALYDSDGNIHPGHGLSGRVVVLVHGLCMSHLSWSPGSATGMGEHILRDALDTTVLYLEYNTGQRISQNGHLLSDLLNNIAKNNPNITELDLIGHSMGGLVLRSAIFYAQQDGASWLEKVDDYISLGSPHHGSALEKVGYLFQAGASRIPIVGNLSHLGNLRSAGIIDLRYGSIRHDDWQGLSARMGRFGDVRRPAPLPSGINTFLVAGSLGANPEKQRDLMGDGLVRIRSALGEHAGDHGLKVQDSHKAIFYGVDHVSMQNHELVRNQVVKWLNMSQEQKNKAGAKIVEVFNKPLADVAGPIN